MFVNLLSSVLLKLNPNLQCNLCILSLIAVLLNKKMMAFVLKGRLLPEVGSVVSIYAPPPRVLCWYCRFKIKFTVHDLCGARRNQGLSSAATRSCFEGKLPYSINLYIMIDYKYM